jgi:anti-sigma regulatory factor (Ser/Thr protein kinase)
MNLSFVCRVNICPVTNSRVRTLYKIAPQPGAPAQARRIIAEELASRLPVSTLDDIKLMVSELVTNGVVHGSGTADDPVMLDLRVNGNICCRVLDRGSGFARGNHRSSAQGLGEGLRLVELLSDRWGMQRSPECTEVWFERQCA